MKSYTTALTAALIAASIHMVSAGDITGKVKLKGTAPAERPISFGQSEPTCGPLHKGKPLTTRHYVVGADHGLGNVFVYIKEGAKPTPPPGEGPTLDQVGCEYQPFMMGVQAGQKFKIKNSDPFMHNIHAMPKPGSGNKEFNNAQPVPMVSEKVFDKPEVLLKMKCDVHEWMFAYIGVVDHPYFAVTDKDGSFKLSNVPAGDYTIEAVHVKAGRKTQKVTLGASDSKTADFELEVPAAP
jgi:hypothetical protein